MYRQWSDLKDRDLRFEVWPPWLPCQEVNMSVSICMASWISLITLPGGWLDIPEHPANLLPDYPARWLTGYPWLSCQEVDRISLIIRQARTIYAYTHFSTPCVSHVYHSHCLQPHCIGKDLQDKHLYNRVVHIVHTNNLIIIYTLIPELVSCSDAKILGWCHSICTLMQSERDK
jgi:hypothetical protein